MRGYVVVLHAHVSGLGVSARAGGVQLPAGVAGARAHRAAVAAAQVQAGAAAARGHLDAAEDCATVIRIMTSVLVCYLAMGERYGKCSWFEGCL